MSQPVPIWQARRTRIVWSHAASSIARPREIRSVSDYASVPDPLLRNHWAGNATVRSRQILLTGELMS